MAFEAKNEAYLRVKGVGKIKVTALGGRGLSIAAPDSVSIEDRRGRPLSRKRQRLTQKQSGG